MTVHIEELNARLMILERTVAAGTGAGAKPINKFGGWEAGQIGQIVSPAACFIEFTTVCLFAGTIVAARFISDVVTNATAEVYKVSSGTSGPPTIANKISGSSPITLTAAKESLDTTLSTWSGLTVAIGDKLAFKLLTNSASGRLIPSVDIVPT